MDSAPPYQNLLYELGRLNHDLEHLEDNVVRLCKGIALTQMLERLYALKLHPELLINALRGAREGCAICEARSADAKIPQATVRKSGPPFYKVLGAPSHGARV